uniref:Uncharacterized protein n=1 Tax=Quercus lobata TaxID=97700 RepID=A0A7N2R862_QUELO
MQAQQPNMAPSHPCSLISNITLCKTIEDLNQVHAHMIKTAQIHYLWLPSKSLDSVCFPITVYIIRTKVFDQMPQPNCFSWNTIIINQSFCREQ